VVVVAARQNATGRARVVVVAARQNTASGARVSVVATRQNTASGARVSVVATRQNTASRAAVSVAATRQNTTASVAATQDTTSAAGVRLVGAVTAQNPTARVVSVAAAAATQNATCGRRVRRIVVGGDGGTESRLGRGVRGFVGGAVVPSEADVAEDRGDYATFFVGCVVVVVVSVIEGVVVAAAAGEGVGRRHGCFLCFRGVLLCCEGYEASGVFQWGLQWIGGGGGNVRVRFVC